MNDTRLESLESTIKELKKKKRILGIISAFLVLVILCLILYICLHMNNKVECQTISNNNSGPITTPAKITINDTLLSDLRELIPTIKECNTYYYRQYDKDIYIGSANEIMYLNNCDDYTTVLTTYQSSSSTKDEVYIIDYVLLKGSNSSPSDYIYGKTYKNLEYKASDILKEDETINDEIIKKYGAKYKYTFKLNDDNTYAYISTEMIKEES